MALVTLDQIESTVRGALEANGAAAGPAAAVAHAVRVAESKGNMWFWKPGLSRPVSVSKRQRLTGDAAIGDIASTSFVDGYKLVEKADGEVNGEAASVYTLKANSLSDTYAQIKYWVTKNGNLGRKAEFYAKSGNMIRSSTMDYGNTANGKPFLSKMVIQDGGQTITLSFSDVRIGNYPDKMFTRDHLTGRRTTPGLKK